MYRLMSLYPSVRVIMASSWKNYSMAQNENIERFLRTSDQVDELEKKLAMHEVQCDERWKTCFQRLEDVERGLLRIESRMLLMGGTVIMFLAGVLVTLATKM